MAVKSCSIDQCESSSVREEDFGVTYLKLPKDVSLRELWLSVSRLRDTARTPYVCSRHFCKNDFEKQDSKYVLKSDAVPSIFPWNIEELTKTVQSSEENMDVNDDDYARLENGNTNDEILDTSKESEVENLEAIKDFIAFQEQEIIDAKAEKEKLAVLLESNQIKPSDEEIGEEKVIEKVEIEIQSSEKQEQDKSENQPKESQKQDHIDNQPKENEKQDISIENVNTNEEDAMAEAARVMEMILTETEAKVASEETDSKDKKQEKSAVKQIMSTGERGNTMALSVGSRVEARDFGEDWHPAQILEVDFEEMEVLVHYEVASKKFVRPDEWISVSSPRLRPEGSGPVRPASPTPAEEPEPVTPEPVSLLEEIKHEEKPKVKFEVGERCLARWRDNRRFIATVTSDLGEGIYEILFDDGARWSCNTTRLYKLKENSRESTCVDNFPFISTPPPLVPLTTGSQSAPAVPLPLYHTHLFDPARDYLGTKSERREMKRKLNIKEIFNIGQKKPKKMETPKTSMPRPPPKERKPPKVVQKQAKTNVVIVDVKKDLPIVKNVSVKNVSVKRDNVPVKNAIVSVKKEILSPVVKKEIPEAIASIIGTLKEEVKEEPKDVKEALKVEQTAKPSETDCSVKMDVDETLHLTDSETLSAPETQRLKQEAERGVDNEMKLEKLEAQESSQSGEVIDRIKEVITKLEDGLSEIEIKTDIIKNIDSPKVVIKEEDIILAGMKPSAESKTKNLQRVKKGKKMKLLQEKRVNIQVEKVKCELEIMKKQMQEMKKAMLLKTEEIAKGKSSVEMPESFLLPGEWCCKWVNGQPVGAVSEMEGDVRVGADNKPALPRRSVQVEDKRLPEGWTKHMVRRSLGSSAGKWDVVLVSPENRRFHTKTEMKHYFEHNPAQAAALKDYNVVLNDFGIHVKLSRRMGWYTTTEDGVQIPPAITVPAGSISTISPLVKKKKISHKREREKLRREKDKGRCRQGKAKLSKAALMKAYENYPSIIDDQATLVEPTQSIAGPAVPPPEPELAVPSLQPLEDGCVYVGSLKVQIFENLLRCPAEGCFKNFRNDTLLKMHIKHYHRELRVMLGATPAVLDLAYARTRPSDIEMRQLKLEAEKKTFKVKLPKLPKRLTERPEAKDVKLDPIDPSTAPTALKPEIAKTLKSQSSPKLRTALGKPIRRPKVLLPVKKQVELPTEFKDEIDELPKQELPMECLDFETAISTHTVTKPATHVQTKRKSFASLSKITSEDEEWMGSDPDTRSSYPRSGTPDSKNMDQKLISSESNEEHKEVNNYLYTETGERIKIVHMKREEIINCHCGFREEDGLMVQCELCLCWQHALCHNIQREADVPEKYTCSICLNPRRGRRSQRFLHDQDRLYEGLLPGARPCEALRRSHELSGNLHRIQDALHALKVKCFVATNKNHPKLYLWAKDWEMGELNLIQERLNSDYSDLNIMISSVGKENLPLKDDLKDIQIDIQTPPSEDHDMERFSQKDVQIGSQSLLSGLLSSPGGASLDLPISTSELERLAKTVQEEARSVIAPQPEAAIENSACRERLLRHIQRCQALVDARLDSIEAQVAELESQDPSFEDDETADFFPRTKQTVQMLMRDLDTMEELGVIT